jgi:hypothetical protein
VAWRVILLTQPAPLRTQAQITEVAQFLTKAPRRRLGDGPVSPPFPPISSPTLAIALGTGPFAFSPGHLKALGAPAVRGVPF